MKLGLFFLCFGSFLYQRCAFSIAVSGFPVAPYSWLGSCKQADCIDGGSSDRSCVAAVSHIFALRRLTCTNSRNSSEIASVLSCEPRTKYDNSSITTANG